MTLVIAIMIGAGLLGGTINYFLSPSESQAGLKSWLKCALVGTGASLLIPLFLNTIASELVDGVLENGFSGSPALVFAGFCLIAAITSQRFITSVSDAIFQKLKDTEKKTEQLEQDLQVVESTVEAIKEPELIEVSVGDQGVVPTTVAHPTMNQAALADHELGLLKAMYQSKYPLRSLSGIASQLGKSVEVVLPALESLEGRGFLTRAAGKNGERWGLTSAAVRRIT